MARTSHPRHSQALPPIEGCPRTSRNVTGPALALTTMADAPEADRAAAVEQVNVHLARLNEMPGDGARQARMIIAAHGSAN